MPATVFDDVFETVAVVGAEPREELFDPFHPVTVHNGVGPVQIPSTSGSITLIREPVVGVPRLGLANGPCYWKYAVIAVTSGENM